MKKKHDTTSIRLKEMKPELEEIAKRRGLKLHTLLFNIIASWYKRNK